MKMNTKQSNILNNRHPDTKATRRINGSSGSADTSGMIAGKMATPDNQLISHLKEVEEINIHLEELVEDSKKKLNEAITTNSRFLKLIAHDLRNPFCATIGILDLLKESYNDGNNPEFEELLSIATNSANNALDLLENLLEWSISQSKEKSFNPVRINLQEVIIGEFESFNTSANQKEIKLKHSIDPNLHVTADFEMVKTIFRNLISNAIKYTPTGGNISVSASEGKQFVKIEVCDNGIGMSQKTKEKLFKIDEFHSTMGTNNELGSGLGLLFCKEFIDLHGGKIRVESEPGKGSKFKFTLPHYI
jgi:signal transduction histidine kinase